jgi:hypothetical protein
MLEKELEALCKKKSGQVGCLLLKLSPQYLAGLPDRLLIGPGGMVLVEFKRPGGKVTPLQAALHKQINRVRPGSVYVIDSKEGFLNLLQTVSDRGSDVPV